MKPRRRSRGVTLIELMVVLAIFAIVTVTILPEFAGTRDDARLRSTARRIASALNLARSQAVATLRTHRLVLDADDGRFRLEVEGDGEDRAFGPARRLPETGGRVAQGITLEVRAGTRLRRRAGSAPPEGEARASLREVRFFSDGTADAREVVLRDREGFGILLRVDPVTGRTSAAAMPRRPR